MVADAHFWVPKKTEEEMFQLSGQTLAPVIQVGDEVLADFGTDQLEVFWKKMEMDLAKTA